MDLLTLVWRELVERPATLLTSALTITLGMAAVVAIRHITVCSEQHVESQLRSLGANVLVLPQSVTLHDYYSADLTTATIPESYVSDIFLENLPGVERLSPRLCIPVQIHGRGVILTGIQPQNEFQANAAWKSVSIFSKKHDSCRKASCDPNAYDKTPDSLVSERTVDTLKDNEAIIGPDVAEMTGILPGASITLLGETLDVIAVLPPTGTVDDSRIFAHLHTVQRLSKSGEVLSAIEIIGCCDEAAGDLAPMLSRLLPDTRIVTVSQVVSTQVGVNRLMTHVSLVVLGILVIAGGASVANVISSNVRERRREIGTLLAIGAKPRLITWMFLLKAWLIGALGATAGYLIGVLIAMWLGAQWIGVAVTPLPFLPVVAVIGALVVATIASLWPIRSAINLDPCVCFLEV